MKQEDIEWELKKFDDLDTLTLYQILDIRNKVFVEGQNAVYLDTDYKDLSSLHLMGFYEGKLIAYSRLFDLNGYYDGYSTIGRVAVLNDFRRKGIGKLLVSKAIEELGMLKSAKKSKVKIAAQAYLQNFYESFGFNAISDPYMYEGILHIDMILDLNKI